MEKPHIHERSTFRYKYERQNRVQLVSKLRDQEAEGRTDLCVDSHNWAVGG